MNLDIEKIKAALESYKDFFDPGDEYCTCDLEVGFMCEMCARRMEAKEALAALEAYDPDAIRCSRDAYDFALEITARVINRQWTTGALADKIEEYIQAKLADPDAIRRECAEAIEELKNTCLMHFTTLYEEGIYDGYQNAIDAIMSKVKE